ncbi:uncharacterized protein LOC125650823 [Ostrea edulis]|uniref:uncharacterized protein LOC125650823 n=1 Tax=Ostrea edulis TaxID=37623 RepID=UPI0020955D42|nr:uncharacterized protein LOC125650823 [Ostrea edulis]
MFIIGSAVVVLLISGTALSCGPPGTTHGGFCPIEVNNPVVLEMAQFAVKTHANKFNAINDGTISVSHASSQVVSGYNYKMTVTTSFDGQETRCLFVVYDQSWTNTRELTTDDCHMITKSNRAAEMHRVYEGRRMLLDALYK